MTRYSPFLMAAFLCVAARAQDTFEIQVYEWETVPKGRWSLETHLNYIGKGSKAFEGLVAPTNNQFHMTYELTRGITEHLELAGYLVLARRAGMNTPLEYAGWRLRPRVSLPKEWKLPMDVSISAEFGFPRPQYEDNKTTFELRPILEKKWGPYQLDLNPTVTHAIRGPGTADGWEFEPAVRFAREINERLDLSGEYYGGTGPFRHPLPGDEQTHQFYPGGDFKVNDDLVVNFGVGFAATPAGGRFVYKIRIGYEFGGKKADK